MITSRTLTSMGRKPPSGARELSPKNSLQNEVYDAKRAEYNRRHRGSRNASRTARSSERGLRPIHVVVPRDDEQPIPAEVEDGEQLVQERAGPLVLRRFARVGEIAGEEDEIGIGPEPLLRRLQALPPELFEERANHQVLLKPGLRLEVRVRDVQPADDARLHLGHALLRPRREDLLRRARPEFGAAPADERLDERRTERDHSGRAVGGQVAEALLSCHVRIERRDEPARRVEHVEEGSPLALQLLSSTPRPSPRPCQRSPSRGRR
jgi:hypothetical protein